ncbi:MAG TPA: shikimate kinase, partial [Acidobacteriota bacterium]|nr:shikimate kinase [Acidobacteriota bacterium]
LDYEIERSSGEAIESIFATVGEPEFRKRETKLLESIAKKTAVIATGGGTFIFNKEWMMDHGTVVYLELPFQTLASRIGAETSRPLWKNAEQLFAERQKIYESAHLKVDATRDVDSVANEIIKQLRLSS